MTNDPSTGAVRVPSSGRRTQDAPIVKGGTHREFHVQDVRHEQPVTVAVDAERRDRVRWGPVWAGVMVALPTFLLLELAFFALGWLTLDIDPNGSSTTAGWITGLLGLFAFFLGGLTAGATAMWRGASDGLLHGILVWALGVVALLFFSFFGGGALFGSAAEVFSRLEFLQQQVSLATPNVDTDQLLSGARDVAGVAVLGLGLSVAAAALGGVLGGRMWPRAADDSKTVRLP